MFSIVGIVAISPLVSKLIFAAGLENSPGLELLAVVNGARKRQTTAMNSTKRQAFVLFMTAPFSDIF